MNIIGLNGEPLQVLALNNLQSHMQTINDLLEDVGSSPNTEVGLFVSSIDTSQLQEGALHKLNY
jgi:hypothetical protein